MSRSSFSYLFSMKQHKSSSIFFSFLAIKIRYIFLRNPFFLETKKRGRKPYTDIRFNLAKPFAPQGVTDTACHNITMHCVAFLLLKKTISETGKWDTVDDANYKPKQLVPRLDWYNNTQPNAAAGDMLHFISYGFWLNFGYSPDAEFFGGFGTFAVLVFSACMESASGFLRIRMMTFSWGLYIYIVHMILLLHTAILFFLHKEKKPFFSIWLFSKRKRCSWYTSSFLPKKS